MSRYRRVPHFVFDIDALKNQLPGIIAVTPQGSKEARAQAASPEVEAGNYYVPKDSMGDEFIEECASFPNGSFDDRMVTGRGTFPQFLCRRA